MPFVDWVLVESPGPRLGREAVMEGNMTWPWLNAGLGCSMSPHKHQMSNTAMG